MCTNKSIHTNLLHKYKFKACLVVGFAGCLRFVIVVFPDHTRLLFLNVIQLIKVHYVST